MWEIVWYIVNTQEVLIQKCSPPLSDRTVASCREFNNLYKLLSFYCPSQETLHFELPSSFLYHRSCKMLFYIPVSQTVEVRRATFCLIWILTFPESPRSTFWKLFPGQSAAFISICHSLLTFSLLAHFSNPFPVICENRKPFPVLTKSLSCAWSNFCGRQLFHLRLASCRLVSVMLASQNGPWGLRFLLKQRYISSLVLVFANISSFTNMTSEGYGAEHVRGLYWLVL